ncbi:DUF4007 family protein [Telmatospirillum siberiense]|uniref:DUF4007 domain-containing protein n=1 Tax=Telmatospirillum siberiense TaxID=382514 RepID=A0A2N3PR90_9PROT|nr:DUF4007 family protein [Telmatospirillum siberiense]PKU22916.1 DUF4007 domain-containing protein [Telmatospirillum siberiense]
MTFMALQIDPVETFRFGGHQTFPLRIAWLPKAVRGLSGGQDVLGNIVDGVIGLGLGKNMVEALRCWVDAYGVARRAPEGWRLTEEGEAIFGPDGFDPFLEDVQTQWWLHWKISTQSPGRFFAWELLFNRWNEPSFTPSAVLVAFAKEAERSGRSLSEISLRQHFDVWLRTYCAPRGSRLGEDGLDSPLVSLGLVRPSGEREELGRREPIYTFDLSPKRTIAQAMFRYCLMSWWEARGGKEETVPFHEMATGVGSPGRILRMPESEVRNRLNLLARTGGEFELVESLNQQVVRRIEKLPPLKQRLAAIYASDIHAKGARHG